MSGHELWEVGLLVLGALLAAWSKRQDDRRAADNARLEDQRKETGRRIGRLEAQANFERGRRAGLREKARKGNDR